MIMIQQQTMLDIADNTGAKLAMCIKVLGGSSSKGKFKRRVATVGYIIICAVKKTMGSGEVKNGQTIRRVVVEGINRVWKHVRPSQRNPQGGRIQKDAPIHVSNVMPLDPTTGKGTRVKFETRGDRKHRIAVGSGTDLGVTGKA